jgi:hypothetical protein
MKKSKRVKKSMRLMTSAFAALAAAAVATPAGAQVVASGNFSANGYAVVPFTTPGGIVDLTFNSGYGDPTFAIFNAAGTHLISNDDANASLYSHITRNLAAGSYTLLVSYCCSGIYNYSRDIGGGSSASTDGFNTGSYVVGGTGTLSGLEAYLDANPGGPGNAPYSVTISNASTSAGLLTFNRTGVGHILYVPYFSTQEGNVTAVNVVNTDTVNGKVLKVRFRGASNSDDVYDFQVFLSPGDVWTAGISQGSDGRSRLDTADKSCTLPASVNGAFIASRTPSAGGNAETREGYIEILTMADIVRGDADTDQRALYTATKHVKGVAPCTSSVLTALTHENAGDYMAPPTTGIMANWTIINVSRIVAYSGDAAAIEARASVDGEPVAGRIVYWDQRPTPLTPTQANANTADPLLRGASPVLAGARYDLPDLSTPYLTDVPNCPFCQSRLLSDAITATEIAGEFYSEASVGAQTDWVVSFPTRRYFAAVRYTGTSAPAIVRNATSDGNIYFTADNTELGNSANGGKAYQICTRLGTNAVAFYDREETPTIVDDIVISPGTPTQLSICGEVSVVGVNNASAANSATFGSVARSNVANGFTQGWGSLTVPQGGNGYYNGLPMLARQFTRVNNTQTNVFYGLSYEARVLIPGTPPPFSPAP